jgi:hypothetical protein
MAIGMEGGGVTAMLSRNCSDLSKWRVAMPREIKGVGLEASFLSPVLGEGRGAGFFSSVDIMIPYPRPTLCTHQENRINAAQTASASAVAYNKNSR